MAPELFLETAAPEFRNPGAQRSARQRAVRKDLAEQRLDGTEGFALNRNRRCRATDGKHWLGVAGL
jgi:hypothetical protein